MELNEKEKEFYQRQILLNEFGEEQQLRLKNSKVLVIGAGGLGCPVLQYLNAAGVGVIGICDGDAVSVSNLHRQILYSTNDVGKMKTEAAKEKLCLQNPFNEIILFSEFLSAENAIDVICAFDLVMDCSDNFATRYLINDVCVELDKPFVSGSVFEWTGNVSVFNAVRWDTDRDERSGTYRCIFPEPPMPEDSPDCETNGVIGVLPGIIGSIMASEAIKIFSGVGEILSGKLLMYDLLKQNFTTLNFKRNEEEVQRIKNSPLWNEEQYQNFCNPKKYAATEVKEISAAELKKFLKEETDFQLIDVREVEEHELLNIGGENIPLDEVLANIAVIEKEKPVVFYCKVGQRSAIAIERLQDKFEFNNLYNLKGGVRSFFSDKS